MLGEEDAGKRLEFPPQVPQELREVIGWLSEVGEERAYMEAIWRRKHAATPGEKESARRILAKTVTPLRERLDAESPFSPEVSDRMQGLQMALSEARSLEGYANSQNLPGTRDALKDHAAGLVDAKTELAAKFRISASMAVTPESPPAP